MVSTQLRSSVSDRATAIENALRSIIRGNDDVVRLALVAVMARGHLLIEGVPGVGKTTLAHAMARALDCAFQRLQFTSDMLPSDVLGISVYSAVEQQFEFKAGPVFSNVLLADEINRTTPKTQSALLEAMNEGQVTVDGHSHPLPRPFLVIATQNPVEHHGTYPLPESQLDRFLLRVSMGYPQAGSEREILRSEAGAARLDQVRPVATGADVVAMQEEVQSGRIAGRLCAGNCPPHTRDRFALPRRVTARIADALSRSASHGVSRWTHVHHAGRLQDTRGPGLRAPRGRQRAVFIYAEEVRAGGNDSA